MLYFPQIKNTAPQIGDFGATETALASAPLFRRLLSQGADQQTRETGWAVLTVLNCLNSGQPILTFSPFYPLLSYLFLFFPLGNGLKPV